MAQVTERDFRMPEFRDADPKDYEFRSDGKIVRKDRWEMGIRRIRSILGDTRREFEIDDIVMAVRAIVGTIEAPSEEEHDDGVGLPADDALIAVEMMAAGWGFKA